MDIDYLVRSINELNDKLEDLNDDANAELTWFFLPLNAVGHPVRKYYLEISNITYDWSLGKLRLSRLKAKFDELEAQIDYEIERRNEKVKDNQNDNVSYKLAYLLDLVKIVLFDIEEIQQGYQNESK